MKLSFQQFLLSVLTVAPTVQASCPYLTNGSTSQGPPPGHPGVSPNLLRHRGRRHLQDDTAVTADNGGDTPGTVVNDNGGDTPVVANAGQYRTGDGGIPEGGFEAVEADIAAALTDSQDFFPADFEPPFGPNYGGLMIRLAWHCSGSFRESDGRGGCDGARIRFDPELNWPDNANLNFALQILEPIKEKYGSKLSWGDLIILAGNTAIKTMGGPTLGFCGGRIDDPDGSASFILGPSDAQEELAPCVKVGLNGRCPSPLGPTTVGLIYVNPEGPVDDDGKPQPDPVLSGEDIRQAFARMGFNDTESVALIGGGHAFGKCHGPCLDPPCGRGTPLEGIGPNTFTSGLNGQWTTRPTTWTNDYFNNLFNIEWELITGPGGAEQWAPVGDGQPDIIMLTSDLALGQDEMYKPISEAYAGDISVLENDFAHAWYRLTSADMGPRSRCIGGDIPPGQFWQYDLPEAPATKPSYVHPRTMIQELIDSDANNIAAFSNLAYRCAFTYRETDYKGGCNGARIRFEPEASWESNAGTSEALATLEPIKEAHPDVSWADLIALAGQTAVESAGGVAMDFCGGRTDASDGAGSEILEPRLYDPVLVSVRDDMQVKGLSPEEGVALYGRPQSNVLSNQFFIDLKAGNGEFSPEELALLEEEFVGIVDMFAADNDMFLEYFSKAWTYMMTADRYAGPRKNACAGVADLTIAEGDTGGDTDGDGDMDGDGDTGDGDGDTGDGDGDTGDGDGDTGDGDGDTGDGDGDTGDGDGDTGDGDEGGDSGSWRSTSIVALVAAGMAFLFV